MAKIGKNLLNLLNVLIWIAFPIQLALLLFLGVTFLYFVPPEPTNFENKTFVIKPESDFGSITSELEKRGLIRSAILLRAIARYRSLDTKIKFGEYRLSPSMSTFQILHALERGNTLPVKVSIPEGSNLRGIQVILDEAGLMKREEFEKLIKRSSFIGQADAKEGSLEGYLFPDTYFFDRNTRPELIIKKFIEEGNQRWIDTYQNRARELGFSKHEILTLASIVEKESSSFSEQPLIASVFLNRLKRKMKLQSDPTVIYGIPNFNGNITKSDLTRPTPYNTYTEPGLPPGPICSPGEHAIRAVLFPATTKYLYFVANGKGRHVFSTNYEDHLKAVSKYQLGRG